MTARVRKQIEKALFRLKWLVMSEKERYAYLWARTRNNPERQISARFRPIPRAAISTVDISGDAERIRVSRISSRIVEEPVFAAYSFSVKSDGYSLSKRNYVLVRLVDLGFLLKESGPQNIAKEARSCCLQNKTLFDKIWRL